MNRLHDEIEKFFYVLKHADIMKIFDFDLSVSELILIKCIHDLSENSMSKCAEVSDIVEKIPVSAQAISKCFRALEQKGYIERYTKRDDRRRTEVLLTDAGCSVYTRSQMCVMEFSRNVFDCFDSDEYEEMIRLMKKLRKVYSEKLNDYTPSGKVETTI